ncbi:MAG: NAD(P)-dependent alcohol dehydrogenase [Trueperaceae bacterium]|nr:MAG: NAD(P)-dependent alcohol dehydrogenase [Trueperaceae bacterium]
MVVRHRCFLGSVEDPEVSYTSVNRDLGEPPSRGFVRVDAPQPAPPRRLPLPTVGPRDVLVRVHAAALHRGDAFTMAGRPLMLRFALGLRRPGLGVPGRDLAGSVVAVGSRVEDLAPGDDVFGWTAKGSLAEYVAAPADHFVRRPAGASMAEAAGLATSGLTALQACRDVARIRPGQRVLVVGASGGFGHLAIQIAKALRAHVTAVCSAANLDFVRSLGADRAIDYAAEDVTDGDHVYDVILANVETSSLAAMRRILGPDGTLVPNDGTGGGPLLGPLPRIVATRLRDLFTRQRLRPFLSLEKHADLVALAELVETGRLMPVVGRTFALDDAAAALRQVATGHTRAKVVVAVAEA